MRKLGKTMAEARRNLPQFLAETDLLLAQARGDTEALKPVNVMRTLLPEELAAHTPMEVVELVTPRVTPYVDDGTPRAEYDQLLQIAQAKKAGTYKEPKTKEELLKLAASLKQPAIATAQLWDRHLSSLMECANRQHITEITEEDVLNYRAKELEHISANTMKTKLRYIRALLEIAKDQKWIGSNPADGATKHIEVKAKVKVKEVVRLDQADAHWQELPEAQHLLWHLCRWTGAHISEVAGLRGTDINLEAGVINITPTEERPLKNVFRQRTIPIHRKLLPVLIEEGERLQTESMIFPWAFNPERHRWCEGISWKRKLGVTPKATRDWAATCLREEGVNEKVIGVLFGHAPTSITQQYGSVTQKNLRAAIDLLK